MFVLWPVRCVSNDYVCDADDDCRDGSDETAALCADATCSPSSFVCANGRCVSPRWHCDFDNDCGDNSDELGCGTCCSVISSRVCDVTVRLCGV